MIKPMTLGVFLNEVLQRRRLTASALAEGAHISQSGLSNILQGKAREPDPRTLKAIADYLQMDVFSLFRLVGYVPPASEVYGAYSPLALYIARRFEALPVERQSAFLNVLEALVDEPQTKRDIQALRRHLLEPPAREIGLAA